MRQNDWNGVGGDADALGPAVFGVGLGAAALYKRNRKQILFSQELEKWEKKADLNSVG